MNIDKKSWEEFRSSGILWFVNRLIHVLGWSIVFEFDENGKVVNVYPARTKYRGFTEEQEDTGFVQITKYMAENCEELEKETSNIEINDK